jgi:cytidine deaminase
MTTFDPANLQAEATKVVGRFVCSDDCSAGAVAAALLSESGEVFTGICIDTACSLGFCAEHAAIAEMLKRRQTKIVAAIAVTANGEILPPCGRCRELIHQIDPANWDTKVVLSGSRVVDLRQLLPYHD